MAKKILFLLMILGFALTGCQPVKDNRFAIYLLEKEMTASEMMQVDISQLVLASDPIISSADIVSYDKNDHTIVLTKAAYSRVLKIFPTPVRVAGIPFVVCVGNERIYAGAFWTPLSSLSYEGIVIMEPFEPIGTTIQIEKGYPGSDFFTGTDPRTDPRIMNALPQ